MGLVSWFLDNKIGYGLSNLQKANLPQGGFLSTCCDIINGPHLLPFLKFFAYIIYIKVFIYSVDHQ